MGTKPHTLQSAHLSIAMTFGSVLIAFVRDLL